MYQKVGICLSSVRGKIARPPREISTTGHTPTSCCPCPTCMFTGTAVLPAYLHNPVFPDGVSEGSPHKLPLVLICILSPETGSVGSSAATRQPNHVYLSPSAAPHLAKDQFWGNEPVVQKTCPMLNLLCRYVLAMNISKPFLFTTFEYTDILHPCVTSVWISVAEVAPKSLDWDENFKP